MNPNSRRANTGDNAIESDGKTDVAAEQIEAAIRRWPDATPLVLSAYSDGSVTGRGVAGAAAIVIETTHGEVVSAATATLARDRRRNIDDVPTPWGVTPQQDALRGAITCHDLDGRCSYSASNKCHSAANHWSRCIVVDHPDVAVQWEDTVQQYTATRERMSLVDLIRCERCAVGIHLACAIDYSEWSGKVGEPGGAVR